MKQIVIYILSCNRTKSQKVAPKQEHYRKHYIRKMPLSYLRGIFWRCLAELKFSTRMNSTFRLNYIKQLLFNYFRILMFGIIFSLCEIFSTFSVHFSGFLFIFVMRILIHIFYVNSIHITQKRSERHRSSIHQNPIIKTQD